MYHFEKTLHAAFKDISKQWDNDIIPQIVEYIKIPNKSPSFDPNWKENGYMDQAMQLIVNWCKQQSIKDIDIQLHESEGRTPLLFIDIPGQTDDTILLYGHMDKQPEMAGWDEDLGPWKPVIKGDKLYGRGGADDGYAAFAALNAIATLQRLSIPHARCVVIIEASEESGSDDLPFYLEKLKQQIGKPNFVVCLDSFCGKYEQMWSTTSLRGVVNGDLSIKVLSEGIHSGLGSGVIPSTFRVLRMLLDRIEDTQTGEIILEALKVSIPEHRLTETSEAANALGQDYIDAYPLLNNTQTVSQDVSELILNRTWRAALSVTGQDGLPLIENAGNVTLPELEVKLSMRIPPLCDPKSAQQALKQALEKNPPYNAEVSFKSEEAGPGWHAPALADWLREANDRASNCFFEKPAGYLGEGGSIPFMGMLTDMYPDAQFLITGVLGPHSNAHGPNEFLHIPMAKKITGCIAHVIARHYEVHSNA